MRADQDHSDETQVLVVPPTRRDGEVTGELLAKAGIRSQICRTLNGLAKALDCQSVGAVLLTDMALLDPDMPLVKGVLSRQPAWSDVPVIVLTRDREHSPMVVKALEMLSNVILLDRPISTRSMISAVLAALRSRQWQYRIREQLVAQEKAEQALRDADRRKDEFLATLAHELRNPLAPIRTGLHVLARTPAQETQAGQVRQMMERQVTHLVRLIDDLLDVSRIATGKVVLKRERLDLRSVVAAAIESCQSVVDRAGHDLKADLPKQPVWVVGDPSRLAQVVSNLVNNAAKYTPERGSIKVLLDGKGGQACIAVQDNGAGIPPDMLEDVFSMFTQVDQTLDRAQGGLGIGLSLVRRLVSLHGGDVTAQSPGLNQGSTFTVSLPMVSSGPARERPSDVPDTPSMGHAMRVLIVDDNKDAADSLAILLQASGHEVRKVYTGVDALQTAEEFVPQVVLCDIGLPGMDGHEIAMQLRANVRHATCTLVALTGWGTEKDKRRTRDAGFDEHLVKPVDFSAINAILERL